MSMGQMGHGMGHQESAPDLAMGHLGHLGHPPTLAVLAALLRCPDCDSQLVVNTSPLGICRAAVRHDDTCPTYRAMRDTS